VIVLNSVHPRFEVLKSPRPTILQYRDNYKHAALQLPVDTTFTVPKSPTNLWKMLFSTWQSFSKTVECFPVLRRATHSTVASHCTAVLGGALVGINTGCWKDKRGADSLFFVTASRLAQRPIPPPIEWFLEVM
jgi:hypothetical protein